mmetsp:Transcript_33718/g.57156  ORF Transcript_33718/g.57156 Transcript_33718/m.57156 type:complete len:130 (+) Transcript_33718:477-866(+)
MTPPANRPVPATSSASDRSSDICQVYERECCISKPPLARAEQAASGLAVVCTTSKTGMPNRRNMLNPDTVSTVPTPLHKTGKLRTKDPSGGANASSKRTTNSIVDVNGVFAPPPAPTSLPTRNCITSLM